MLKQVLLRTSGLPEVATLYPPMLDQYMNRLEQSLPNIALNVLISLFVISLIFVCCDGH
jgi:hypothetical protein